MRAAKSRWSDARQPDDEDEIENAVLRTTRAALLLSLWLCVLSGCGAPPAEPSAGAEPAAGEGAGEPVPSEPAGGEPASDPTGPGAGAGAEMGAPAADPGAAAATLCERARACCAAYVAAIPSARRPLEERACTEIDRVLGEAGEATDEACEAAIGGWRQSLQLTGIEVPAACLD